MRARRGLIAILGWRILTARERGEPMVLTCPACGQRARFVGRRKRVWFTLFAIPVCPLEAAEDSRRISECCACGERFDRPLEQMPVHARAILGDQWGYSIRLYNKLREHPADSATLNELMESYAAMGEPAEAITAARLFPQALRGHPRCQETLARIESERSGAAS